jgi:SAM-dependent methyltransferase
MLSYNDIINKIECLEESNILISALELNIFSVIGKKSMTAKQISYIAKIQSEGAEILLNALAGMGVLLKSKNKYKNSTVTYKYFCSLSPEYKKGTVMLKKENRSEYEQLHKIIKFGRDYKQYESEETSEFRKMFTYAMHERSQLYADKVAKIICRNNVGKLCDLGSGPGSYSVAILNKDKKAFATLIDRPPAIKVARQIHKNHSTYKRINFVCGDLFADDFESGFNTILLSNIIHIYNSKENKKLFKKIYKALELGGRFILYDYFLHENKIKPYDAALFAVTMLLYTKTGKSYTSTETISLLKDMGFTHLKKINVSNGSSIIECVKK